MFHLKTIFNDDDSRKLLARVDLLTPELQRRWGKMTAHQAVVHLNDSMRAIVGERHPAQRPYTLKRRITAFVGFTLPFPWPRGRVKTSVENDQMKGGTKPGNFSDDVVQLKALVQRIRSSKGIGLPRHHAWGDMKPSVLGRYVYRHINHHLRQFGL